LRDTHSLIDITFRLISNQAINRVCKVCWSVSM